MSWVQSLIVLFADCLLPRLDVGKKAKPVRKSTANASNGNEYSIRHVLRVSIPPPPSHPRRSLWHGLDQYELFFEVPDSAQATVRMCLQSSVRCIFNLRHIAEHRQRKKRFHTNLHRVLLDGDLTRLAPEIFAISLRNMGKVLLATGLDFSQRARCSRGDAT